MSISKEAGSKNPVKTKLDYGMSKRKKKASEYEVETFEKGDKLILHPIQLDYYDYASLPDMFYTDQEGNQAKYVMALEDGFLLSPRIGPALPGGRDVWHVKELLGQGKEWFAYGFQLEKMKVASLKKIADENEKDFEQPEPGDYVMSSSGPLGSKTSVSIVEERFLGEFDSEEEAEESIKEDMEKHKFYSNVWIEDDHGGVTLTSLGSLQKQVGYPKEYFNADKRTRQLLRIRAEQYGLIDIENEALTAKGLIAKMYEWQEAEHGVEAYIYDITKKQLESLGASMPDDIIRTPSYSEEDLGKLESSKNGVPLSVNGYNLKRVASVKIATLDLHRGDLLETKEGDILKYKGSDPAQHKVFFVNTLTGDGKVYAEAELEQFLEQGIVVMAGMHSGSQYRETLEEAGYEVVGKVGVGEDGVILYDTDSNKYELWYQNDDFAGYVVEIDGIGYEFGRSILSGEYDSINQMLEEFGNPTKKLSSKKTAGDEFIAHGTYMVSNVGGYEIMLSEDGEAARVRDAFGSDNPETSDWLPIEDILDGETGETEPVIDPNGYNIPLNQVMDIWRSRGYRIRGSKKISQIMHFDPKSLTNIGGERIFYPTSEEYRTFDKMTPEAWNQYVGELKQAGIDIKFNKNLNAFVAIPVYASKKKASKPLALENIAPNILIESRENPEWGRFRVLSKYGDGIWEIRGEAGDRVLFDKELHFWNVVEKGDLFSNKKKATTIDFVGFAIGTSDEYTIEENAKEKGITLDWAEINKDAMQIEANVLSWLNKAFGTARDEGHDSDGYLIGTLYPDEAISSAIGTLIEDQDVYSTGVGNVPFNGEVMFYQKVSDMGASVIDVTIQFFDAKPKPAEEDMEKLEASKQEIANIVPWERGRETKTSGVGMKKKAGTENIGSGELPNKYYVTGSSDFLVETEPHTFDWASGYDMIKNMKSEDYGEFDTYPEALAEFDSQSQLNFGEEPEDGGINFLSIEDHITGELRSGGFFMRKKKTKWGESVVFNVDYHEDTKFTSDKLGYDIGNPDSYPTAEEDMEKLEASTEYPYSENSEIAGSINDLAPTEQRTMFASEEDTIKMPKSDFFEEHDRLVDVLKSPSHEDDLEEAGRQEEEEEQMKAKMYSYFRSKDLKISENRKDAKVLAGLIERGIREGVHLKEISKDEAYFLRDKIASMKAPKLFKVATNFMFPRHIPKGDRDKVMTEVMTSDSVQTIYGDEGYVTLQPYGGYILHANGGWKEKIKLEDVAMVEKNGSWIRIAEMLGDSSGVVPSGGPAVPETQDQSTKNLSKWWDGATNKWFVSISEGKTISFDSEQQANDFMASEAGEDELATENVFTDPLDNMNQKEQQVQSTLRTFANRDEIVELVCDMLYKQSNKFKGIYSAKATINHIELGKMDSNGSLLDGHISASVQYQYPVKGGKMIRKSCYFKIMAKDGLLYEPEMFKDSVKREFPFTLEGVKSALFSGIDPDADNILFPVKTRISEGQF